MADSDVHVIGVSAVEKDTAKMAATSIDELVVPDVASQPASMATETPQKTSEAEPATASAAQAAPEETAPTESTSTAPILPNTTSSQPISTPSVSLKATTTRPQAKSAVSAPAPVTPSVRPESAMSSVFTANPPFRRNSDNSQISVALTEDSLSLTESQFFATKHLSISDDGLQTRVDLTDHGLDVDINERSNRIAELLKPAFEPRDDEYISQLPPFLKQDTCPKLNVVIQIVGSRGDVQPFVSLGKVLHAKYGHRVRIATHFIFKSFVEENGLEFFNIGGDPAELMAFMVHNPGLIPDVATLRSGEVGKRRRGTFEMLVGCWRSCVESGDGTGPPIFEARRQVNDGMPFIADAIIANPPSFAHIHCAEKLGIPLHLMFTMPWSPTRSFPHPLVNIKSSNADGDQTNFLTYALVEMMTWQGLGDVINKFRRTILNLQPISLMWAPGMNSRLRIPFTYCWSPALIPKPKDWGPHISISGFYFLSLASSFSPAKELLDFLAAGPPPVYIGFGSIVVDDPDAMTEMIFSAVKKLGIRALVSKGWGGLGGDALQIPEDVFMLGNVPHDWLFQHVSAVVHHGGAGTTAAGVLAGRPTVVVPFFGDQPFWGAMIARAGAGPSPIPFKELDETKLVSQLEFALKPETLVKARELGEKMAKEDGAVEGACLFHANIGNEVRCSVVPERSAVWRIKKTEVKLSGLVATVLINRGLVDLKDLKLYRAREYQLEDGPWDPVSGVTSALIGTFGSLAMGVADLPTDFYHSLKTHIDNQATRSRNSLSTQSTVDSGRNTPIGASTPRRSSEMAKEILQQDKNDTGPPSFNSNMDGINKIKPPPELLAAIKAREKAGAHRKSVHPSSVLDRSDPTSPLSPDQLIKRRPTGFSQSTAHAAEYLVKAPLDLLSALSGGFHNAPKLYGDTTVRPTTPISGIQSGVKVATKDFALGIIDGVSGLITHPIHGAQQHGVAGLLSGVVKGVGGLVLKPVDAVTSVPANLLRGIYKELEKSTDFCLQTHIILSRVAQGLADMEDERRIRGDEGVLKMEEEIVGTWKEVMKESDRKATEVNCVVTGRKVSCKHGLHFKKTRNMTFGEAALYSQEKGLRRKSVSAPALIVTSGATISDPLGSPATLVSEQANDRSGLEDISETVTLVDSEESSSVFSSESDDAEAAVGRKMEVKVGKGVWARKHLSIKDVVLKLKGLEHEHHEHHKLHKHHLFHKHGKDVTVAEVRTEIE